MGIELPTRITLQEYSTHEKGTDETFHTITNIGDDVRWERLADRNPPAVKLIRRGKGKEYIATISKDGQFKGLYASWEPILEELERQKVTNKGRRIRHDEVGSGFHPELAVGTDSVFGVGKRWEGGEPGLLRDQATNEPVET